MLTQYTWEPHDIMNKRRQNRLGWVEDGKAKQSIFSLNVSSNPISQCCCFQAFKSTQFKRKEQILKESIAL